MQKMSVRPVYTLLLSIFYLAILVLGQSSYWLANIPRQGQIAFGDPTYPVFRNVMDYGATGNGVTDDTNAINAAIQAPGDRCGGGDATNGSYCQSSTLTPALIYFPPGTYVVSSHLIMYYGSQLVGDALNLPTIKIPSTFDCPDGTGCSVFDSDIYIPGGGGAEWYANQNNFYRQLRNFIIDLTEGPVKAAGVHWQVAQATSIQNVVINLRSSTDAGNAQTGISMENGSGGFISDVVINGGSIGAYLGSQQFTMRNLTINGASTGISMGFDWVWLFTQLQITNCNIGIDMSNGGFASQAVGSIIVIDSAIGAVQGIVTSYAPDYSSPPTAGSLMLENVDFTLSDTAVVFSGNSGRTILPGGQVIKLFAQGNAWTTAGQAMNGQYFNGTSCAAANSSQQGYTAQEVTIQRQLTPVQRPASLVDSTGKYVARSKPQYQDVPYTSFLSAKSSGLAGDGITDDTVAMQNFLNTAASAGKIAYFDHGAYIVSDTINVPANLKITGECYPIIMATGSNFQDQFNPRPVWSIGTPGQLGSVEMSDIIFETKGPTPGAIMVEWNIMESGNAAAGMWDAHFRIGGSAGTDLQQNTCLKTPDINVTLADTSACTATFLLLHVTNQASGYFENVWGWVADHELDMGTRDQISIFNGRGFLIEGDGPTWFYGTSSEHSQLYSYQWANARNHFAGVIQSETAYWQGNPSALEPFTPQASWNDPTFANCTAANCARTWGARFVNSSDIYVYGSGLYNFFDDYNTAVCLGTESCQEVMVDMENSDTIYLWALATKGATWMVNLNGYDLVNHAVNMAGFCATVILFELQE